MRRSNLLFWVFLFLRDRHPAVYDEMKASFWPGERWPGAQPTSLIQESLADRVAAFEVALDSVKNPP